MKKVLECLQRSGWTYVAIFFLPLVLVGVLSATEKVSTVKSDIRVRSAVGGGGGLSVSLPVVDSDSAGVGIGGSNVIYSINLGITSFPDTLGALIAAVPVFDGNTVQLIQDYPTTPVVGAQVGAMWSFPQGLRLQRTNPTIVVGFYRKAGDVVSVAPGANTIHAAITYRVEPHWE